MSGHMSFLRQISTWSSDRPSRILSIGTDCSGIESPIQALNILKIPYVHLWSSDIDQMVKQSIMCNYRPKVFYPDIFERDHRRLPHVDLYVAGFPCQAFSTLGKREGFDDEKGRGTIFFECYQTIKVTQPIVFILENVKGLTNHDHGRTFKFIMEGLSALPGYRIYYQLLNTSDYGIPQNRQRIYIVGIKGRHRSFNFPDPVPLRIGIEDIIDPLENDPKLGDLTSHKVQLLRDLINLGKIDSLQQHWFVNLNVSSAQRTGARKDICPCLLAGEGGNCIYFLTSIGRRLSPREYLRLQGFPDSFRICVPGRFIYKQVGNAMSVPVLCFLWREIFRSVRF